jgi:hypothetical protein
MGDEPNRPEFAPNAICVPRAVPSPSRAADRPSCAIFESRFCGRMVRKLGSRSIESVGRRVRRISLGIVRLGTSGDEPAVHLKRYRQGEIHRAMRSPRPGAIQTAAANSQNPPAQTGRRIPANVADSGASLPHVCHLALQKRRIVRCVDSCPQSAPMNSQQQPHEVHLRGLYRALPFCTRPGVGPISRFT